MRIAQICPYSLSIPGGVQGQVMGLARALRTMGHEARVLAPCDGPPPDPMVTPLGASLPTASNGSVAPIAPDPACALRTVQALHNEGFDVLHLHEPLVPGPTLYSLVASDTPAIGTFHASGSSTGYKMAWFTRKQANKLKARLAVSPDARDTAIRNVQGQYDLLYNGIDVELFASAEPAPKRRPTIFFIGRHETRKGLSVLIEAMRSLPDDVDLWIAGHGPLTSALKAATSADDRIVWLGRISDADKVRRLRSADVFCAPSIEGESFGIVLLEAMAAGTPVVASDIPGYRNVIDAGTAQLAAPNDAASLSRALEAVLTNEQLRHGLITSGTRRAEQFSMRSLAEKYVEYYEKALRKHTYI